MPARQTDNTQNESHLPHNSPRIFGGCMGATSMHHAILLPAQVLPLNLSPFTQITLHTLGLQMQSTRTSRCSRWRPGWGGRAQLLCGRRTEDGKQSSADVLESCVSRSPQSCGGLRGRPRARACPHHSLAARGFSVCAPPAMPLILARAPAPAP
jgi:hypothetical protein